MFLPITIIGLLLMITVGNSILDKVFFSKMQSGSGVTRNNWNAAARKVFENNRIWGQGYKTQRASSLLWSLLAETGIVGFLGFVGLNISLIVSKGRKLIRQDSLMIMAGVICMFIACLDLDLCLYWFIMYIIRILRIHNAVGIVIRNRAS